MIDTLAFKKCFAYISIAKDALANRDSQTKAVIKSIGDYREYESQFGQTVFHNQIEDFLRGKSDDEKARFIEDLINSFLPYKNALEDFKSTEELFIPNIYLKECKERIDSFFAFLKRIEPTAIKGNSTKEGETAGDEQPVPIYNPDIFKGHFKFADKDEFLELLNEIKDRRLYTKKKTIAAIALIFYKSKRITNCKTYQSCLGLFCECYGQSISTYKPNDVKFEAENLKRKYNFLDI